MVTCINVVVDFDDNDVDGAMDPPAVTATGGSWCDGTTLGGGGGGGGIRLLSDRGGILAGVSPPPSITTPRSIACACSTEWRP